MLAHATVLKKVVPALIYTVIIVSWHASAPAAKALLPVKLASQLVCRRWLYKFLNIILASQSDVWLYLQLNFVVSLIPHT